MDILEITPELWEDSTFLETGAAVLGKAFFEDPFYTYAFPDPQKRAQHIAWWMRFVLRYGYLAGKIYATAKPVQGVAIWLPPHAPELNLRQVLRLGFLAVPLQLGLKTSARMIRISNSWEALRAREAPHWYLMIIGILPESQRQGIGSALIHPILTEIEPLLASVANLEDAFQLISDLENSETNVIFEFLIENFADDDTRLFLKNQLRSHVGNLLIKFPLQFRSAAIRRGILVRAT